MADNNSNTNKTNKAATKTKTVLSPRNQEEWMELCEWVEVNIFDYNPNQKQKLKRQACLALEGLRKGQDVANNENETYGEVPLKVILMTFKAYKAKIRSSILGKTFKNEISKMVYVCKIVQPFLNDMHKRYLNAEIAMKKIETIDYSYLSYEGAKYQSTQKKVNKDLEDLW